MSDNRSDAIWKFAQTVSVLVGVVISLLAFFESQKIDANARVKEAETRKLELSRYEDERRDKQLQQQVAAAAPFLCLRQKAYMEVLQVAAIIAEAKGDSSEEVVQARKRFRQLYIAELSMVEGLGVEHSMVEMANAIDPTLIELSNAQRAAFNLAHALRDSLAKSWHVDEATVKAY